MPGATGTTSLDVAAPKMSTGLTDEKTSTWQAGSLNRRKVTVPVEANAPTSAAWARTGVPTGPPGEEETSRPGARLAMVMVKVWQAGGDTRLFPQTVVGPKVPAESGTPVTNPVGPRIRPGGRAPLVTRNTAAGAGAEDWNRWR